eukprot:4538539-Pyramimonas_sp.AAC.1
MDRSGDREAADRSEKNDPRGVRNTRAGRHDTNLPILSLRASRAGSLRPLDGSSHEVPSVRRCSTCP